MSLPEVKIVILGGGGVGKSALTIRLLTDNFLDEYDPTIEDSYRKIVVIDGTTILLDILDTAGQEEFSSLQDQWMRQGQVFGLVYSITSRTSFDEVVCLADKIMRVKDLGGQRDLEDRGETRKPIVLIANKCDLPDECREVSIQEGQNLADLWGVPFFETSAKEKINNYEAIYELARVYRRFIGIDVPIKSHNKSHNNTNNIDCAKIAKWIAIILCCICIGIFMLFYYLYKFIISKIQCCRSREELRLAMEISKKEAIEKRTKAERQKLKFFAVKKLPLDTIPAPILSLKNFRIKRKFGCMRCCIAIFCGLLLPIIVLGQTIAFIVYHISGNFKYYPDFYPYDRIHDAILLDFFGMIVGREPGQDPETVKNKQWFMRQTRTQIMQRSVLTLFVLFSFFICYYNATYYEHEWLSYMETIGPFVLFWSAWILLSIWIGYEPELYPQLPLLSRLRSIPLFFGETFTHRTDAYKFLRAYARSRESNKKLSWKQSVVIVFLALLYSLMPQITRLTVGGAENQSKNLFIQISAICINFLFVVAIVYAIEVQYSQHFDNYREWMHDLTMLLSKDSMDKKQNDSEHLLPEKGSNFSKNLFLSLTRRSNALGWIEIRSFLAIEGKLLFGEQELPTLWLMIVTITLSIFLLVRVYVIEDNPINSILFNALAVLNLICMLSLARIAVTGYQFEFLQYQQERLWSEQKVYMRCNLSDTHQFDMNQRTHVSKMYQTESLLQRAKGTELTTMKTSKNKPDVEEKEEIKEEQKQEKNKIGVFAKRKKEFDSIWSIGKCFYTDRKCQMYEAKKEKIDPYSTPSTTDNNYVIKVVDFKSLTNIINECKEIDREQVYEIIDTYLDVENNKAMIVMKKKQEEEHEHERKKEKEIQNVISIEKMRRDLSEIPEELRVLTQIQNVVDDKLDGINWNSYNFGFMEDMQDIVKSKDIFPRLFKIKLNSVLAKALAGAVFTCLITVIKVFIE